MQLIDHIADNMLVKIGIAPPDSLTNKDSKKSSQYVSILQEKEDAIMELLHVELDSVLYSKYYWLSKYKKCQDSIYGLNAGIEQQQYKILEEIEQRLSAGVDWELIQWIEELASN